MLTCTGTIRRGCSMSAKEGVKRYDVFGEVNCRHGNIEQYEEPDGDWCKWEDVLKELKAAHRRGFQAGLKENNKNEC